MNGQRLRAELAVVTAMFLLAACGGPADTDPADQVESPRDLQLESVEPKDGTLEPSLQDKGAESERLGGAGHEDR